MLAPVSGMLFQYLDGLVGMLVIWAISLNPCLTRGLLPNCALKFRPKPFSDATIKGYLIRCESN